LLPMNNMTHTIKALSGITYAKLQICKYIKNIFVQICVIRLS
jgi:hypothetical protein